jgi:hypothetical protein
MVNFQQSAAKGTIKVAKMSVISNERIEKDKKTFKRQHVKQ